MLVDCTRSRFPDDAEPLPAEREESVAHGPGHARVRPGNDIESPRR